MTEGRHTALYRHPTPFRELTRRYRHHWGKPRFAFSTLVAFASFLVSVFLVQPYVVDFATDRASNSVTDIVLSNIPIYHVDGFFVYGMFLLIAFIVLLCLLHPKRAPFALYALTLFVLIRCVFVSLTHLAPFAPHIASDFGPAISRAFFGADLFFSGHTGAPFLMALMYWREKRLRYIFLLWSGFFAVIVLLGHFHYSIDVLSAFFITYGIFHLAEWVFPKSRALFLSDEPIGP